MERSIKNLSKFSSYISVCFMDYYFTNTVLKWTLNPCGCVVSNKVLNV